MQYIHFLLGDLFCIMGLGGGRAEYEDNYEPFTLGVITRERRKLSKIMVL